MVSQSSPNRSDISSAADLEHKQKLRQLVTEQLNRQRNLLTTVELIDSLIDAYPTCPRFISMTVDRLLAGDEALANALRKGGF